MALKDILVCLDPTDAGERRLRLAAAIARQHQAHLSAAYIMAEAIPGAPPYEGIGVAAPAGASEIAQGSIVAGVPVPGAPPIVPSGPSRATELADIVEQRFRQEVAAQAGDDVWHLFGPGESDDLITLTRTFDLVVYSQASAEYRLPTGFGPEDIVIASGRPMLVVPYAGEFASLGKRVLVAWDGTREASRALHDCLPLIAKAEAVTAITVSADPAGDRQIEMSLDRVVRHLERHGIAAKREETPRGDIRTADVLLSRASDIEADLIVAGAYHHSQLREAIVGGVSRELLDHMTVPVLMSH
jgi:nucleotide-binding universal stress UspA family protein